MKFSKILCLVLAVLMIGSVMIACGGSGNEGTTPVETEGESKRDPVNVNIVVKEAIDGKEMYASDEDGYDYDGEVLTVQEILIDFMTVECDADVEVDEKGKLVKVGDLVASETQFFLFSIAKHPKGAEQAEPVEINIDEYSEIANGDTLVIYLS